MSIEGQRRDWETARDRLVLSMLLFASVGTAVLLGDAAWRWNRPQPAAAVPVQSVDPRKSREALKQISSGMERDLKELERQRADIKNQP